MVWCVDDDCFGFFLGGVVDELVVEFGFDFGDVDCWDRKMFIW